MPSPVLHEAGMPRARDHLTSSGHADRRASGLAPFEGRAPVVHRLVKGTLHSHGLVAGRYQPLADGDTVLQVLPDHALLSAVASESEAKRT